MRVVAVVTMQAKPRTCCGAFTLFRMYRRGKSAGLTPAAVSMLGLGLSVFKGLRQADQHSAHERGIILRERVHDLQSSLARRTHGSLRFPCVRTERLLHVRACVGSPARDVVKNGFPLLFGAVARLLGGLLDAVEELFFKRLELLESLFHARFLEARATFGQFLQRDLVGFDDLEQGIIHPRQRVREGFFHIDLALSNANVNAFSDLAHHAIDLLQAQFAHLQRLKREVANGGPYLFVLLYRLGSHRLEHLVRIDRWGFHLILLPTLEFTCSRLESARYCMCWPPLIAILAPVTNAAPSEHR